MNPEKCNPDIAFTCGLLHDIGKLVMSELLQEETAQVDVDEGQSFVESEQKWVDMNHAELALWWEIPEIFQEVIRHHHEPSGENEQIRPLVFAVHLGDLISIMSGFDTGIDNLY